MADVELGQSNTLGNQIVSNDGLFKYITNVYLFSGIGWIFTLTFAVLMSLTITLSDYNILVWIYIVAGFVCTLCSGFALSYPLEIVYEDNGNKRAIIANWKVCIYIIHPKFIKIYML